MGTKKALKDLSSLYKNFPWIGDPFKFKAPKVSWDIYYLPKEKGEATHEKHMKFGY